MPRSIVWLVVAAVISAVVTGPVFAHARLKNSSPGNGASGPSPTEIDLTFSETLNLKFSGATVTGPAGEEVKLGNVMLKDKGDSLTVPVPQKLPPGSYRVVWHALSDDGHKTTGSFSFNVK